MRADPNDHQAADRRATEAAELGGALATAFDLSRRAAEVGLVVTALQPQRCCDGRYGCHFVQLWTAQGEMWAEGSHESTADVGRHIGGYRRQVARSADRRDG